MAIQEVKNETGLYLTDGHCVYGGPPKKKSVDITTETVKKKKAHADSRILKINLLGLKK